MKIKSISATNLKGSSFTHSLADMTHFYGNNFVGKSTRVEALTLVLCHCVPGVATRPGDVLDLFASSNELKVFAEANDDGSFAEANWARNKKGGVETLFEGSLSAPKLLFSTSEFLDLTPKERTRFLFSVLPPPPLDKVGPEAIITHLKNVKGAPHTEAHEKAVNEFCEQVRRSHAQSKEDAEYTVQAWLEALVDEIATTTKEKTVAAKTMRQTALGNASLRKDAPLLAPVEEAKRKAQSAHTKAVTDEQSALNQFTAAERMVQEAKALAAKLVNETLIRSAISAEEKIISEAKLIPGVGERPGGKTMLHSRPTDTKERAVLNAAEDKLAQAARDLQAATFDMKQLEDEIAIATQRTNCPTCGHDITDQQKKVVTGLRKKLKETTGKHVALSSVVAVAKGNVSTVEAILKETQFAMEKWDADWNTLNQDNQTAITRWDVQHRCYTSAQTRILVAERSISEWKSKLSNNTAAAEAWAKLPAQEKESAQCEEAYNTAKVARVVALTTLTNAEQAYKEAIADAAASRTQQAALDKAVALEAQAEIGQQLREMLHTLLQECVKQSIQPLLDLCNGLCRGILPGDLVFDEGEVKMTDAFGLHSHRTFSGTEKALTYAALSVGLAAQAPLKLLVLDELGRLDRRNKTKLAKRLHELLTKGILDQVITVDTEPLPDFGPCSEAIVVMQVEISR